MSRLVFNSTVSRMHPFFFGSSANTAFSGIGAIPHLNGGSIQPGPEKDVFSPRTTVLRFGNHTLHFSGARRKIMTYNVKSFDSSKKTESLHALGQIIKSEEPDIIALQEVGDEETLRTFIMRELDGMYPHVVFPPQQPHNSHRLAIISKENLQVIDFQSHIAEQNGHPTSEYYMRRDFLEATIESETGYRLKLFTAHFNAKNPEVRQQEAESAATILRRKLARNPDEKILVVGDINIVPHESPADRHTLETLAMKDHPDQAFVSTLDESEPIFTSVSGHRDHMLASKALQPDVRKAWIVGKLRTAPWNIASDHLAGVTEIEEPDPPAQNTISIVFLKTPVKRLAG